MLDLFELDFFSLDAPKLNHCKEAEEGQEAKASHQRLHQLTKQALLLRCLSNKDCEADVVGRVVPLRKPDRHVVLADEVLTEGELVAPFLRGTRLGHFCEVPEAEGTRLTMQSFVNLWRHLVLSRLHTVLVIGLIHVNIESELDVGHAVVVIAVAAAGGEWNCDGCLIRVAKACILDEVCVDVVVDGEGHVRRCDTWRQTDTLRELSHVDLVCLQQH